MFKKKDRDSKVQHEKNLIALMMRIYCSNKHKSSEELCEDCKKVLDYANLRIDKCRYMETKTFCSACDTPCYNTIMRNKMKDIMSYSGKRLIFYHPFLVFKHIYVMIMYNIKKDDRRNIFKGAI